MVCASDAPRDVTRAYGIASYWRRIGSARARFTSWLQPNAKARRCPTTNRMPARAAKHKTPTDVDSSDSEAGPSTSKSSSSLATFVNATTVLKSKRRRTEVPSPQRAQRHGEITHADPPLAAFPRLSEYEATDRPRTARRTAYISAKRWLDHAAHRAREDQVRPHIDDVVRAVEDVAAARQSASLTTQNDTLSFIDASSGMPAVDLWRHLSRTGELSDSRWSVYVADDALSQDPKRVIAGACRQWLADVFDDHVPIGPTCSSLWRRLAAKLQDLPVGQPRPLLILGLSTLPSQSTLISTLAYLTASCSHSPQVVLISQTQGTSERLEQLAWEERRYLQVHRVNPRIAPQKPLLQSLFLDRSDPSPLYLPAPIIDLALKHAEDDIDMSSLTQILDLALQRLFTQLPLSAFFAKQTSHNLSSADVTPAFMDTARRLLLGLISPQGVFAEPDLSELPPSLRDGKTVRDMLQDDDAFFAGLPSLLQADGHTCKDRALGFELLQEAPHFAEADERTRQALEALAVSTLAMPANDASLRKRLADTLAPSLRALRRSENEDGGMTLTQLDEWLDSLEDWAMAVQDENLVANDLQSIRSFQQQLHIARVDAEESTVAVNGTSTDDESSRIDQIEKKLQRDEALRGLRGSIADWYAAAVRSRIPRPLRTMQLMAPARWGTETAVAIESLLFPSPRAHTNLALSHPQLYLQHFADCVDDVDADAKMQSAVDTLRASLTNTKQPVQTDLSRAFNLLKEAGGPGTGVRGRMINLYDWYQAWLPSGGDGAASSSSSSSLQARFALALSTLSMMGYIRKTRKGNGELVLKTGGWDLVSVGNDAASSSAATRDADDVF